MMLANVLLQAASDVAGEASKISDGTILTGILALTSTIFGALTLSQNGRVADLNKRLEAEAKKCETDLAYERARTAEAAAKEDKCLERLPPLVSSVGELSAAIKENAVVGTAITQEVRNHATRVDAINRTQETMCRDVADNKRTLEDIKRAVDDLRYGRARGAGANDAGTG